jgi:hypothetical protein
MGTIDEPARETLIDLVARLDELPDCVTIYAERLHGEWRAESLAVVRPVDEPPQSLPVIGNVVLEYVLEAFIAREALQGWLALTGCLVLSNEERLRVLVYYAENDAWPAN